MAINEASRRLTIPIRNLRPALNHFAIMLRRADANMTDVKLVDS